MKSAAFSSSPLSTPVDPVVDAVQLAGQPRQELLLRRLRPRETRSSAMKRVPIGPHCRAVANSSGPSRPSLAAFESPVPALRDAARARRRAVIWKTSSPQRSASSTARRRSGSGGKERRIWMEFVEEPCDLAVGLHRPAVHARAPAPSPSGSPSRASGGDPSSSVRNGAGLPAKPRSRRSQRMQAGGQLDPLVVDALVLEHQHPRPTGMRDQGSHRASRSLARRCAKKKRAPNGTLFLRPVTLTPKDLRLLRGEVEVN